MNNDKLQEIISVYHSLQKDSLPEKGEGWVNMAKFGPALLKAGIDYKGMGYEKLNEFVSKSGLFEVYSDTSCKVPVKYIKEKYGKAESLLYINYRNFTLEVSF